MISLPPALTDAIAELLATRHASHLRDVCHTLTDAYRHSNIAMLYRNPQALYAYLAVRMPATYAAIYHVLADYAQRMPAPKSLLDIGAGPGTVGWAAFTLWPELRDLTAIEANALFIDIGKSLCENSPALPHRQSVWQQQDILNTDFPPHDVITASYMLGEIDETLQTQIVQRAWAASQTALILIEPGTPKGYQTIVNARQTLIDNGAMILAPCPHQKACPKSVKDWCHFSQRLERSSLHRLIKDVSLPYEDEKFSYVIAVRSDKLPKDTVHARIVAHPRKHTGHVSLELCTPGGVIERRIVPKRMKDMYHTAKKVHWGDLWPYEATADNSET